MKSMLEVAEREGLRCFFYGSSPETLSEMQMKVASNHPKLVARFYSPPFRPLTLAEEQEVTDMFKTFLPDLIWVSLGCPRQEVWMRKMADKVPGVKLGVGAAFEFYARKKRRAPLWLRQLGLEWLHRMIEEPGRLWRRYFYTNLRFLVRVPSICLAALIKRGLQ